MKKPKKPVFKIKPQSKRLVSIKFEKEALIIRCLCERLSRSCRKAALPDRIKMRHILNTLTRGAERLEGKA